MHRNKDVHTSMCIFYYAYQIRNNAAFFHNSNSGNLALPE
nr:MAG TPA: hypothetical protein [Caudoviricetes sp.]